MSLQVVVARNYLDETPIKWLPELILVLSMKNTSYIAFSFDETKSIKE